MKKLPFILTLTFLLFSGCYKNFITNDFNLNDTVSIHVKQTFMDQTEGISITFDSVKNDSR